jgi:hypothetical protein
MRLSAFYTVEKIYKISRNSLSRLLPNKIIIRSHTGRCDGSYLFGYTYPHDYPEREEIQSYFGRRTVVFGVAVNM